MPEVTFLDVFKYIYQEHIHTSTGKCQTMFTSRFHNVETIKQHLVLFYNPTVFHKMLAIMVFFAAVVIGAFDFDTERRFVISV